MESGLMLLAPDIRHTPHVFFHRVIFLICGFIVCPLLIYLLLFLSRYFVPYLLYFVLSAAALLIVIAPIRIAWPVAAKADCSSRFRFVCLSCCLLTPALIVSAGVFNNNHPQLKECSIELPRKASSLKELKIVFASDFHLDPDDDHVLDRFITKANSARPDIILIGGDMMQPSVAPNLDKLKMLLRRLRARYGVYAIKGNEDGNEFNREFYASAGIKLLEENIEKIDSSFYLAGFQKESGLIEDFLKAAPDDLPIILLRHIPKDLEIISRSRVDLQLSGHTHNGQLFPLNLLIMPRYYELAHGIKVKRNTIFAVTCGIRSWDSPVKTAGYSEILFIKVSFRSDINTPAVSG